MEAREEELGLVPSGVAGGGASGRAAKQNRASVLLQVLPLLLLYRDDQDDRVSVVLQFLLVLFLVFSFLLLLLPVFLLVFSSFFSSFSALHRCSHKAAYSLGSG